MSMGAAQDAVVAGLPPQMVANEFQHPFGAPHAAAHAAQMAIYNAMVQHASQAVAGGLPPGSPPRCSSMQATWLSRAVLCCIHRVCLFPHSAHPRLDGKQGRRLPGGGCSMSVKICYQWGFIHSA
jgi:hypothetical protein